MPTMMVLTVNLWPCVAICKQNIIPLRHMRKTHFSIPHGLLDISTRRFLLRWYGYSWMFHTLCKSFRTFLLMDHIRQNFLFARFLLCFRFSLDLCGSCHTFTLCSVNFFCLILWVQPCTSHRINALDVKRVFGAEVILSKRFPICVVFYCERVCT